MSLYPAQCDYLDSCCKNSSVFDFVLQTPVGCYIIHSIYACHPSKI